MSQKHALVVGAGIAGPALAFWLHKAGYKVTIIERSSKLYKSGQGIDVEGPAREVVQRMSLEDEIKKRTTGEEGFALVDDKGDEVASVPGFFTRSLEIMRGDLAEIFINAATSLPSVDIKYSTTVSTLSQSPSGVTATFSDGTSSPFDIVIGADGMRSSIRRQIFTKEEDSSAFAARDQYVAYFTIPRLASDEMKSRWQNAINGRSVLVRPAKDNLASAYLNLVEPSPALEDALHSGDKDRQKAEWAKIFADVEGEAPRVVQGMKDCDDFYFERIAQIKLPTWSKGRVALVGDAAYAPSPITGEGTNLALVGAYTLAGELSLSPDDPEKAFKAYEERLRAFVDKAQTIPLNGIAPRLANPESGWGIWLFRTLFKFLAWSGVWKLADPGEPEGVKLGEYLAFKQ